MAPRCIGLGRDESCILVHRGNPRGRVRTRVIERIRILEWIRYEVEDEGDAASIISGDGAICQPSRVVLYE